MTHFIEDINVNDNSTVDSLALSRQKAIPFLITIVVLGSLAKKLLSIKGAKILQQCFQERGRHKIDNELATHRKHTR